MNHIKHGMCSEEAAAAEFQAFRFGPPQDKSFGQNGTTILRRKKIPFRITHKSDFSTFKKENVLLK